MAFVCFTPFPNGFKPYVVETAVSRYFIHTPNSEVRLCRFSPIPFLVISEVYGFAVGATTVEELIHYGINNIIGIGYVGAFGGAALGQRFIARATMSDLPLAAHYGTAAFQPCEPTGHLLALLRDCTKQEPWAEYTVWNSNSLYREYPETISQMRDQGCHVVNMDTLSLYAVAPVCAQATAQPISCLYVGTVTDAAEADAEAWQSDLIEAVDRQQAHPHDELVTFMVETFLPVVVAG